MTNRTTRSSYEASLSPIKSTANSRFQMNTTVDSIIDALFVDHWNINTSYPAFYNQCAPSYCSYSIETHNNLLYIILRIIGLYGG